jgi:ribosomal protein L35
MKTKLKTVKAIKKRFKKTAGGKIIHRPCGQDHFNARQRGKKIQLKRKPKKPHKKLAQNIKKLVPTL